MPQAGRWGPGLAPSCYRGAGCGQHVGGHCNHIDVRLTSHVWPGDLCLGSMSPSAKRKTLKIRFFPFSNIVNLKSKKISDRQDVSTIFCSVLSCFQSVFTCLPKANLQVWPSHQAEWRPGGPRTRALDMSGLGCQCWSCNLSISAMKPGSSQIRESPLGDALRATEQSLLGESQILSPLPFRLFLCFCSHGSIFAVLSSH